MTNQHEYSCNGCGQPTKRDMLTVKKALFTTMGEGSSTSKSRVVAWLCPTCVKADPDWKLPPNRTPAARVIPKLPVTEAL